MCCDEDGPMTKLPAFKRVLPGPTFTVEESLNEDVYPPNRILDLSARVDIDRGVFLLSWTAPGGNFNEGTGELCYTYVRPIDYRCEDRKKVGEVRGDICAVR
jgi:hypothetical protein